MGISWPHRIRNQKLYQQTNSQPITIEITQRRWKLLGHILRLDKNTPARKAMKFYFEDRSNKKFLGRKRTTIITTINRDIQRTKEVHTNFNLKPLKTEVDLHNMYAPK